MLQNNENTFKPLAVATLLSTGEKMELKINRRNLIEDSQKRQRAAEAGRALDALWEAPWVKASISRTDYKTAEALSSVAEKLSSECDTVVILAAGRLAKTIRAVTEAVPGDDDGTEIIVFGDTLSTGDYDRLFTRLEGKKTGLVTVCGGKEPVELLGALAILKKFIVSEMGPAGAFGKIYAVCGRDSEAVVNDAVKSEYQVIPLEEGTDIYGANSTGVILPLMIKGADISAYLEGFYDAVSSPSWDVDAWEYGAALADADSALRPVVFSTWHSELESTVKWMSSFGEDPGYRRGARLPEDSAICAHAGLETLISVENPGEDLMTPLFQGCNADGSLNLLLNEESRRKFYADEETPGFEIVMGERDASFAGQLAAFIQISEGIADFFRGEKGDNK